MQRARAKELIVFDLDGTLAKSKALMDREMVQLFIKLLRVKRIAVIGGGKYSTFKMQLVEPLKNCPKDLLQKLSLFPTTSTAFYRYGNGWKKVYCHGLSKKEKVKIRQAVKDVLREINYIPPKKTYGPTLEDRGTQFTFSALGQNIVKALGQKKGLRAKTEWKKKNTPLKLKIAKLLSKRLPGLEVHAAGFTSIDITKKGIDKGYGLRQIEKYVHVPIKKMMFIGDALFPGGNDYAAKKTGVQCIAVRDPEDTKRIIRKLVDNSLKAEV